MHSRLCRQRTTCCPTFMCHKTSTLTLPSCLTAVTRTVNGPQCMAVMMKTTVRTRSHSLSRHPTQAHPSSCPHSANLTSPKHSPPTTSKCVLSANHWARGSHCCYCSLKMDCSLSGAAKKHKRTALYVYTPLHKPTHILICIHTRKLLLESGIGLF